MRTNTLEETAAALRRGQAAIFPTDTVFGLGVSVRDAEGPGALFRLKRRDGAKPIAWLVGSAADLDRYGEGIPAYARRLARAHWPGALTLIVRASGAVPPAFRSAAGTIGLRMPGSAAALGLIRAVGCPLATTSANISGAAAPRTLSEVDPALASQVPLLAEASGAGCAPASGTASTIVDCTGPAPVVVREGGVPASAVKALS